VANIDSLEKVGIPHFFVFQKTKYGGNLILRGSNFFNQLPGDWLVCSGVSRFGTLVTLTDKKGTGLNK